MVWGDNSLIPRPSHCPVFDHLQFAKTEGGRPGPFYHVTDVSVDLCRRRWGEVLDQKNEVEAISGSFCLNHWSFEHSRSEKHTSPCSKQRMPAQNGFF